VEFELDTMLAARLVAVAGLDGPVASVIPLTGGITSAVFAVRVDDEDVVVKIYPKHSSPRMEKEVWIAQFLAQHAAALPLPRVLAADDSAAIVPHSFVVLTKLEGTHLRSLLTSLAARDLIAVYRQLGAALRVLHGVKLEDFGGIGADRSGRYRRNLEYMLSRFDANLREFSRLGGDPRLRRRIDLHVRGHADLFDGCDRPAFCHNDGHDANVLVVHSASGWTLSGLLDFEHALAGDPLFDLAKTHYLSEGSSEQTLAALVEGYGCLRDSWRETFDLYLLHHQLELWNLLAGLDVRARLPAIAAELLDGL
jgi:Ser/Thr protein kinase RdoA (MazF antagonist)